MDPRTAADTFACVYADLIPHAGAIHDRVQANELVARVDRKLSRDIRQHQGLGASLVGRLDDEHTEARDKPDRLLELARTIDDAYGTFGPSWQRAWSEAIRRGHVNGDITPGVVVPRVRDFDGGSCFSAREPGETSEIDPYLRWLCCYRSDEALQVRWQVLDDSLHVASIGELKVACLPLATREDVGFERLGEATPGALFGAVVQPRAEEVLFARLCDAYRHAKHEDAALLVCPELTVTERVVSRFAAFLGQAHPTTGCGVELIVLGLAVVPSDRGPRNQSVVLDAFGEVVFTQNKMRAFTMDTKSIAFYQLDELDGSREATERIRLDPRRLTLLDHGLVGRLAVLICEDLAHAQPGKQAALRLGATTLVSPVMDGPLSDWRWTSFYAQAAAYQSGALVVVANSLVLPGRSRLTPPFGTSLVGRLTPRSRRVVAQEDGGNRECEAPPLPDILETDDPSRALIHTVPRRQT